MVSDTKKSLNNTIYGRANLPYLLDMGTNTVNYMYGANDMRLYKKVDSLGTILKEEYYLRDATGRELAVIDNDYNVNWYIYGKERVASMRHQLPVGMSNLFITGNIPDGLHYAPNELRTDGTVQSADNVILQAGDCVAIMPGFSTPDDADFTAEIKTQPIPEFVYYLYDHLGNTRVTYSVDLYVDVGVDAVQVRRTVEAASDYYPYGKALRSYGKERYQSTYHERDLESGFDYRGARFYDSDVGRFNSLDPLAADYPEFSDYLYVAGNPLMYIDPTGESVTSTRVKELVDGTYEVVGGDKDDGDNGIYIDNNGEKGELIGYSATPESFYYSEHGLWMGTIDPNDQSGVNFLNNQIIEANPNLVEYMKNATNNQPLDFKATNGEGYDKHCTPQEYYRGMPIGKEGDKTVYASARDIGNMAAGIVAGRSGIGYDTARLGFDLRESYQKSWPSTESTSTKYAEKLGNRIGMQYILSQRGRLPGQGEYVNYKINRSLIIKKGEL